MQKHKNPQSSALAFHCIDAEILSTAGDSAAYQWPCRARFGGSSSASTYSTVQLVSPLFVAGSGPRSLDCDALIAGEAGETTKKPLPLKSS